jgi:hypothetical protein
MFKQLVTGWRLKTLLGAAILTGGLLVAATSGAGRVAAIDGDPQSPPDPTPKPTLGPKYKVKVTFDNVSIYGTDDGWEDGPFDTHLEVYGRLKVSGGTANYDRMFGTDKWDNSASGCPELGALWAEGGANARCLRGVGINEIFVNPRPFATVPMCKKLASGLCGDGYAAGRNSVTFEIRAKEGMHVEAQLRDSDDISGDDDICYVGDILSFTEAQLKAGGILVEKQLFQPNNGSATCKLRYHIERVP